MGPGRRCVSLVTCKLASDLQAAYTRILVKSYTIIIGTYIDLAVSYAVILVRDRPALLCESEIIVYAIDCRDERFVSPKKKNVEREKCLPFQWTPNLKVSLTAVNYTLCNELDRCRMTSILKDDSSMQFLIF